MYTCEDILTGLALQLMWDSKEATPPPMATMPKLGTLDLQGVLESNYFFSRPFFLRSASNIQFKIHESCMLPAERSSSWLH